METYQDIIGTLALTLGVGWASGINLYAALLVLGIAGASGDLALPPDLQVLASPLVIGAAGLMYAVEFFADKTPGVDSGWDALHTFIRIPAGALLAAGAVGEVTPALEVAAGILGGGLAATTHATKTGGRLLINTSPEPFSNWSASLAEDVAVFGGLWAALHHPWVFFGLFVAFLLLLVWLVPKIFRALRRLGGGILRLFGRRPGAPAPPPAVSGPGEPPA
ncbi:MAG TPA: DUF4126 domain-containing protein [Gammaproteobacteria bacterium]|uniref:DUF4126 domain-containing protein n=1 Tax=Immundisolibacter sp. TaxID=1934948 RepID=UPI000E7FBEA1|nr:DUF4126 domain-containing protein [Gammaproteobacteria bacterium]MCH77623.1 DUF4126 domain-containing protein [Gammaproteobacteria bacterium]